MKTVFCDWGLSDLQWTAPMNHSAFYPLLADCGWAMAMDHCQVADLSFRDYRKLDHALTPDASPPAGPTVVFMRQDASWVCFDVSKWDKHPDVLGFAVPLVTEDPDRSISRDVYGYSGEEVTKPVRPLTTMLWAEYGKYPWYAQDPGEKCYDASFVGTMHHDGAPFVRLHRANLRRHWGQLDDYRTVGVFNADVICGYVMTWEQAWNVAKKSRVMVCPWGTCEISWRDYEAALGMCMIIKPRQPVIHTTPPNPWRKENVVYCEPDFSDLEDRVEEALARYDEEMLREIREQHVRAGSDLSILAKEFAALLDAFVSPP